MDQDVECVGCPCVPNDQLDRRFFIEIHARRRLHVDSDGNGLVTHGETIQLGRFFRFRAQTAAASDGGEPGELSPRAPEFAPVAFGR